MDYVKPADVVSSMIDASLKKLALPPRDLLIRGILAGGLLGAATTLAFTGAATTGQPIVGALIAGSLTNMGKLEVAGVAARLVAAAESKTIANEAIGAAGMLSLFVKGILCNWLVSLGVILSMTSNSTIGKIAATWIAIFLFFALGYEHAVVNMFLIPTGMLLGAKVGFYDWWVWNQIPVTLGNLVGGFVCTGLALYSTYKPRGQLVPAAQTVVQAAE